MSSYNAGKDYPERDYEEGDVEPGSSHAAVIERVRPNSTVLDVGCASGYLAAALKRLGCSVFGVELNAEAADVARGHCVAVSTIDLDREPIGSAFVNHTFDYIIFADVLEHLREPWNVLADSRALLNSDGKAIISIPNVAHGAVRLALLRGEFDYRSLGILDNTHLRFFTIDSLEELLLRGGYAIEEVGRIKHPVFGHAILVPSMSRKDFDDDFAARIEAAPEADTLQFIVSARPLSDASRESAVFERIAVMRQEISGLQRTIRLEPPPWKPGSERGPCETMEALWIRTRQELDDTNQHLHEVAELYNALGAEFSETAHELDATKARLNETQAQLDARTGEIEIMKQSWIWRLRTRLHFLKRALGADG